MAELNKVTEGLNEICEEVGVCPPSYKTTFLTAEVSKDAKVIYAAELTQKGTKLVVRVACFDDQCVSSCVLEDGKTPAPCCHTEDRGGIDLAKAWVEHLKENGYQVKEIPVED